jgi:hypothetical protein
MFSGKEKFHRYQLIHLVDKSLAPFEFHENPNLSLDFFIISQGVVF